MTGLALKKRVALVITDRNVAARQYHRPLIRNGVPIASCAVAAAGSMLFQPVFAGSAFLLFWPAVVLSTWFGGLKRGLLAAVFSLLFIDLVLTPPIGVLDLSPDFAVRSVVFIALVMLVGLLHNRQVHVEIDARAAQQQVIDILESIGDPFYGLDRDRCFIYVNQAAADLWGKPREALVGKVVWDALGDVIGDEVSAALRLAASSQQRARLETPWGAGSAGPQKWFEVSIYPNSMGLSVYFRDVTMRKHAQERAAILQDISARFSQALTLDGVSDVVIRKAMAALDALSGWIGLVSPDGRYLDLVTQTGIPKETQDTFAHIALSAPLPPCDAVRTQRPVWLESRADMLARYPDLEPVWNQIGIQSVAVLPLALNTRAIGCFTLSFARPHPLADGDRQLLLALAQQCAQALERARLYEVEVRARQAAEEANRLKMQFLGMISHELRTPLASIKGFTTTLLAQDITFSADEQGQFLGIVDQETDRLTNLVEQLLDLSRLQAGTMNIRPQRQELTHILELAMPQLQTLTAAHALAISLPAGLPCVFADAQRIGQVLTNLVGNAAKFAPRGTTITLSARPNGAQVQIDVGDQGPGIPPAARQAVFEAFQQVKRDGRVPASGAGLGLAICKGIVEAHSGRIWIEDNRPCGTRLSFTLGTAA